MVICPYENCSYESTEHGIKLHHKMTHGESLVIETFVCDQCGDEFDEYGCNREGHDNIFCSPDCREDFKRERSTVNWWHECEWCGDEFRRHPSIIYDHKFCSPECHHSWQRENPTELYLWNGGTETVECSWCGEEIERKPHRLEDHKNHYCSRECLGKWRSVNNVGEDAPRWEGGYEPYYGPEWPKQREKAIERDNHECQDCGLSRDEQYETFEKDLEVHHTTPLRTFDDTEKANILENLVTLCSECHTRREHYDNPKLGRNQ